MIVINTASWAWPQVFMVFIMVFNLVATSMKHGQPRSDYNVGWSVIDFVVFGTVLSFGGFFG